MFDWISNMPSIEGVAIAGCWQTANPWNLWPQAGVQGST